MAIRKIFYADHPYLRGKAQKIKQFGPHLQVLAQDMVETMHNANGVGIAGPQIGVMKRIFVAEIPLNDEDHLSGKPFVFINPKIIKKSRQIAEGREGCLSIPGWAGFVNRPIAVEVKAQNVFGEPFRLKAKGLLARVIQHEYDHLEGILYTDYITDKEKFWEIKPEEEIEEETKEATDK